MLGYHVRVAAFPHHDALQFLIVRRPGHAGQQAAGLRRITAVLFFSGLGVLRLADDFLGLLTVAGVLGGHFLGGGG